MQIIRKRYFNCVEITKNCMSKSRFILNSKLRRSLDSGLWNNTWKWGKMMRKFIIITRFSKNLPNGSCSTEWSDIFWMEKWMMNRLILNIKILYILNSLTILMNGNQIKSNKNSGRELIKRNNSSSYDEWTSFIILLLYAFLTHLI